VAIQATRSHNKSLAAHYSVRVDPPPSFPRPHLEKEEIVRPRARVVVQRQVVEEAVLKERGGDLLEGGAEQGEVGLGRTEGGPLHLCLRALHHPRLVAEEMSVVIRFRFPGHESQEAGCRLRTDLPLFLKENDEEEEKARRKRHSVFAKHCFDPGRSGRDLQISLLTKQFFGCGDS